MRDNSEEKGTEGGRTEHRKELRQCGLSLTHRELWGVDCTTELIPP